MITSVNIFIGTSRITCDQIFGPSQTDTQITTAGPKVTSFQYPEVSLVLKADVVHICKEVPGPMG